MLLLGTILVGLGILGANFVEQKEEGIEIITPEETEAGEIFVDEIEIVSDGEKWVLK